MKRVALKSFLPKKVNANPTTIATIEIMSRSVLLKCTGMPVWVPLEVELFNTKSYSPIVVMSYDTQGNNEGISSSVL